MGIIDFFHHYKERQKQKRNQTYKHFAEDEIQIKEFENEYYFAYRGIPLFKVDKY